MPEGTPPRVHIDGPYSRFGYTASGDVNFHLEGTPPPRGKGVLCSVEGCGTLRWSHASVCPGCRFDYHRIHRIAYRVAVVTLLTLILIVTAWPL